ncbi:MAG: L-threonylcarbamoyladenylate synthase [Saprospiraceae bacterium]|nr:L-threonylcarbamoyladenylate synthase [Saprospiraceae bacterium]
MKTTIGVETATAAELLRAGRVVAIPTETVYGLAANALWPPAVAEVFAVKNRPHFDPLIVHVGGVADVPRYAADFPAAARHLAEQFWPGPLTLLLPRRPMIPDLVTSGLERVALRTPDHPMTLELLGLLDFPLAAPSANPFGYVSPTTARHVYDQLHGHIPYILDGGACRVGLESTIVGFEAGVPVVYRLGGLPVEAIERAVGPVLVRTSQSSNPAAPGMLHSHYAPRKALVLGSPESLIEAHAGKRVGVLLFSPRNLAGATLSVVLSATGNLSEAAQRLFAALRTLDQADIDLIVAERVPEVGLGRAINDRLMRAAGHRA